MVERGSDFAETTQTKRTSGAEKVTEAGVLELQVTSGGGYEECPTSRPSNLKCGSLMICTFKKHPLAQMILMIV